MWNEDVANFLIDNARYYIEEFHADGFRYDEISTLISTARGSGWEFCRALTSNLRRALCNRILQNAEFWPGRFARHSGLGRARRGSSGIGRHGVRRGAARWSSRRAARRGRRGVGGERTPAFRLSAIASSLYPSGFDHGWARGDLRREPRPRARRPRSAAARARRRPPITAPGTRAAAAASRTAIPVDRARQSPRFSWARNSWREKPWDVLPNGPNLLSWSGLDDPDSTMRGSSAIHDRPHPPAPRTAGAARRQGPRLPLLRPRPRDRLSPLARGKRRRRHSWSPSFAETTWYAYEIGLSVTRPSGRSASTATPYDHFVNPIVAGNGGGRRCGGAGECTDLPRRRPFVIPANGVDGVCEGVAGDWRSQPGKHPSGKGIACASPASLVLLQNTLRDEFGDVAQRRVRRAFLAERPFASKSA